ncbi:MAG: hypothetical protein ACK5PP_15660 [Acidimicrobiales bacterium]
MATNHGPSTAHDVIMVVPLPPGMTVIDGRSGPTGGAAASRAPR